MPALLDAVAREAGGRIVAALAARHRDLDLAEEAFAMACLRAAEAWTRSDPPENGAGWLYRVANNCAIDLLRRRRVRDRRAPEADFPEPEEEMPDPHFI